MVSSSLKHQRGFGLVQVGIGIALFGMVSAYGIHMYAKSAKESVIDDRAKLVGQRMADIDAAVKSYATQYFVQVQKGEPAQAVTGGYTVPASRVRQPTLQDLVQLGMLRSDAANSLTYNNQTISYAVDFSVDTTGCVIPACNIQAVIRTTAPITDTEGNVDVRRATIAANEASQNNAGVAIPASLWAHRGWWWLPTPRAQQASLACARRTTARGSWSLTAVTAPWPVRACCACRTTLGSATTLRGLGRCRPRLLTRLEL